MWWPGFSLFTMSLQPVFSASNTLQTFYNIPKPSQLVDWVREFLLWQLCVLTLPLMTDHIWAQMLHIRHDAYYQRGHLSAPTTVLTLILSSLCRMIEKLKCVGSLSAPLHQRAALSTSSGVWQLLFVLSLTIFILLLYIFTAAPSAHFL